MKRLQRIPFFQASQRQHSPSPHTAIFVGWVVGSLGLPRAMQVFSTEQLLLVCVVGLVLISFALCDSTLHYGRKFGSLHLPEVRLRHFYEHNHASMHLCTRFIAVRVGKSGIGLHQCHVLPLWHLHVSHLRWSQLWMRIGGLNHCYFTLCPCHWVSWSHFPTSWRS